MIRNIRNDTCKLPLIIGIYSDYEKPTVGPNSYLSDFVRETKSIIEDAFTINDFVFLLSKIIFPLFLLCVLLHQALSITVDTVAVIGVLLLEKSYNL